MMVFSWRSGKTMKIQTDFFDTISATPYNSQEITEYLEALHKFEEESKKINIIIGQQIGGGEKE